jgi:cytochrome c biogenesis protein CcdA
MKYCYACGTVTSGKPLFCNSCGRSYDVKLCPRRHVNPRYAEACSQCGSRELSTPQPKVSFWLRAMGFVLRILLGILLIVISLAVALQALRTPAGQALFLLLGLLIAMLWALWIILPEWFRTFIHWLIKRREHRDEP